MASLLASSVRRLLIGTDPVTTYFHTDHRNTPVATTDAAGNATMRLEHFPFGSPRLARGGMLEDQLFTGKEVDANTGLVFFGARYLDPVLGRWISPDPLFGVFGSGGAGNLQESTGVYAFVGNDPIGHVDPLGLLSFRASPEAKEVAKTKKAFKAAEKKAQKSAKKFDKITRGFKKGNEKKNAETMSKLAFERGTAAADSRDAQLAYSKALSALAKTKTGAKAAKLFKLSRRNNPYRQLLALQQSIEDGYAQQQQSTPSNQDSIIYNNVTGADDEKIIYNNIPQEDEIIYNNIPEFGGSAHNTATSGRGGSEEIIYNNIPDVSSFSPATNSIYAKTPSWVQGQKLPSSSSNNIYFKTPSFVGSYTMGSADQ